MRFDRRNAYALCAGCHKRYTHAPIEWEDWVVAKMGAEAYAELRADARRTDVRPDYDVLIPELEAWLEELDA